MTLTKRFTAPGWYRAALGAALMFCLGMGIVIRSGMTTAAVLSRAWITS